MRILKNICFSMFIGVALFSCGEKKVAKTISQPDVQKAKEKNNQDVITTLEFENHIHDFGEINNKDKVRQTFIVKNTGQNDLIIKKVQPSCGCTVPQYPKEPIAPGEKAEIIIEFDPKGRKGAQNKTIIITANTKEEKHVISFKANIVE